jgi:hypothetical protein
MKWYVYVIASVILVAIGVGIGYYVWGYHKAPATASVEWKLSDQTQGETARDISEYERRIDELERENTELLIAIQSDWEAPATEGEYEGTVTENELTWRWTERGGGYGLADFNEGRAYMYFDPWAFPVDVEITREADGQLGATLSTTEEGLILNDVRLYADYGELFPEKKVGIRCGAGMELPETPVIMAGLEYSGWGAQYEYSGEHRVLITKSWYF